MNETPPAINKSASGLAIWSLVLGILSLTCFSIFSAIPGVICGHTALSRIKRSGGVLDGKGLAIGGLVTGYAGIALALLMIPLMLAIAVPNFVKARDSAQINMCRNNLRQIATAKDLWAEENKKESQDTPVESDLATILENVQALKCPAGGIYQINSVGEQPTCSIEKHNDPSLTQ